MIKTSHKSIFWILIFIFLNLLFGIRWKSYVDSFYYTSMLIPVAIATSYFFNLLLVPKYLSKGRHLKFALYTLYTIIVSVFLSSIVAMISFIVLADLQWSEMNPVVADLFQMGIIIYFIAILFSFIHLYHSNKQHREQIAELKETKEKNIKKTIKVKSNRNSVSIALDDIQYIESLSDYVKIHTASDTIITKEKIGALAQKLPEQFVRIHRSFLINQNRLEAYGHDFIQIGSEKLPLGRKYKKEAMASISQSQVN